MSTTAPVSSPEATPLSEPQRLVNTFIAPSKTFAGVKRMPSWWAPWLVAAILGLVFAYTLEQKVGFDVVAEKAMKASPSQAAQLDRLPPAERAQQMQMITGFFKGFIYALPVVVIVYAL